MILKTPLQKLINFINFLKSLFNKPNETGGVKTEQRQNCTLAGVKVGRDFKYAPTIIFQGNADAEAPDSSAAPAAGPVVAIHLSDLEKRILTILAEGGHAAVAFDENNDIFQVNMYGHPEQDTVAPVAAETRSACRTLLRRGLITEFINGKQNEYVITDKGRLLASSF